MSIRLTAGQALIKYLINQHVEQDGETERFFPGIWGIFGHGNIGGIAQAIQQYENDFPYYLSRNEQAMVHTSVAYAKMKNRRQAFACLSSIGPGAMNMVSGAATATVNRLPVLILAGDSFAERVQAPVLQQVESEHCPETTSNDAFRPVVRYWDRINRPEQLITSLPEVMRTLTSPSDCGAAFIAMPQDIGTYAYDFPEAMFEPRVWHIPRNRADLSALARAATAISRAQRPLMLCGGGARYSGAEEIIARFAEQTGVPVAMTQSGKGVLSDDHPFSLGGAGVAGTRGANELAQRADVVICVGTRLTDFATASNTAFQNPDVRFVNINTFEMDSYKNGGVSVTGDARTALAELLPRLGEYRTSDAYQAEIADQRRWWHDEVQCLYNSVAGQLPTQASLIGSIVESSAPTDVVVNSAGSLPGDLLKLWHCRDSKSYQVEYGFSVMGYEISGGIGAKMAEPEREVFVMTGDASFLMMNSELAVALQEHLKIILVVVDNHGFSSVGNVSEQVGCEGFGCHYLYRGDDGRYSGGVQHHDVVAICQGLGAHAVRVRSLDEFKKALAQARASDETSAIVVETDWHERVGGYSTCWWDMATAEVSQMPAVQQARVEYLENKKTQRWLSTTPVDDV